MGLFGKRSIIILSILLILIASWFYFFGNKKEASYEFITASRGVLVQTVSVVGHVRAADSVDLMFGRTGKISSISVRIGDEVKKGDILARIDASDLSAEISQARANLRSQEAKKNEFEKGGRPEEIQIKDIKAVNAKSSLEDAKRNLKDKIQDAYTKSDDAIRNKADQLFSNPRTANPQFTHITNSQQKSDIEFQRFLLESTLNQWADSLETLNQTDSLDAFSKEANDNLEIIKNLLEKIGLAVNGLAPNSTLTQTTIDAWKSDISTGRTNINTAIANITGAEEKLQIASSNLAVANQELALELAGTREETISSQEALVEEAQANIQRLEAVFSETIIRAPFDGLITKRERDPGEIVSANTQILSLFSNSPFELEANISETDIVKIALGDTAQFTLDAYGDEEIFNAEVVSIDPAETVIEGVVTYKTKFSFDESPLLIKSGMTANIEIFTDKKEGAFSAPSRAILKNEKGKFVRVLYEGAVINVSVETGLRGSNGWIEIIRGVKEGDQVIVFMEDE